MQGVKLLLQNGEWERRGGVHAAGTAFFGDDRLDARGLIDLFAGTSTDEIARRARELNGLFSVICERDDAVVVVSDRIGSRALFYGPGDPLHLGDSFDELGARAGGEAVPADRRLEFLMSTYVSGRDTLGPSIEKTMPGSVLKVDLEDGSVSRTQYYAFGDDSRPDLYDADHYPAWKEALNGAFERLVRVADGRQLALELSGGHDSRLIATMLDRVGYDDVVAFTYTGIQDGANEAAVAKEVAAAAGFDWVEMEITRDEIREARRSALWNEIVRRLGQSGMSHTHPVEVVIHEKLTAMDVFADDPIRLNGHQLFEAGSYVPGTLRWRTGTVAVETVVDAVYEKHYDRYGFDESDVAAVKRRIGGSVPVDGDVTAEEAFRAVERGYWHERMPNYLSMRALVQMDLDVWFPLMDAELLEFWNRLSRADRYGRRSYDGWVERLYRETYGGWRETTADLKRAERLARASGLERLVLKLAYSPIGDRITNSRLLPYASTVAGFVRGHEDDADPAEVYRGDPLLAFVDEARFERTYTGSEGFRYVLADEILRTLDDSGDVRLSDPVGNTLG